LQLKHFFVFSARTNILLYNISLFIFLEFEFEFELLVREIGIDGKDLLCGFI